MRPRLRAKLRAIGLVGGPSLLLVLNLGLWWGAAYLNDYVVVFPTTHFFADDYEPQTLLEIKEGIVSGAHRSAQEVIKIILDNIWGKKNQDPQKVLEQVVQPQDHYLGFIRPGEFCVITSETSGEIWCQRVVPAGERDGIPSWSWPAQPERPYLFARLLPQLFLNSTNQPQFRDIESLVQRRQVYWLKPSTLPQLQYQSGYFYGDRLKNTVMQSRAESDAQWAGRVQAYQRIQMVALALLLVVSPVSLTVFYWDRLVAVSKSLSRKLGRWKRRRDAQRRAEAEAEAELVALEPKFEPKEGVLVPEGGEKMSKFIEEAEGGQGVSDLVPEDFYPAQASNPLMGELLSIGLRWKNRTEMIIIEQLTRLITTKTKLYEARTQQLEAKRKLAQELVKSCDITPIHLDRMRVKNAWLAELIEQERELQNLEHQSKKLDKQIEVAEKERKLEELKKPRKPKQRMTPQEWEDREIRRLRREVAFQIRSGVALADAIEQERRAAKMRATQKYKSDPEILKELHDRIDQTCDQLVRFQGTEYQEDENIL
jgi:hypothetical protein